MQGMGEDGSAVNQISRAIIGCAYRVMNKLGAGFLEKIYENALVLELGREGLAVAQQVSMSVYYDDVVIGNYTADLVVADAILVELKAVRALDSVHSAQCINYLKATRLPACLLINFGNPRVEIRRFTLSL